MALRRLRSLVYSPGIVHLERVSEEAAVFFPGILIGRTDNLSPCHLAATVSAIWVSPASKRVQLGGGIALDYPEEAIQMIVAGPASPVIVNGDEFINVADFPTPLCEGTGAGSILLQEGLSHVVAQVGFDNSGIDHEELWQCADEGGIGLRQRELDGKFVDRFRGIFIGDGRPAPTWWPGDCQYAIEAVDHGIGVDRAAIMENGILFQLEGPDGGIVVDFITFYQMRNGVASAVNEEGIVEAAQGAIDGVVFAGSRVYIVDILVAAVEQDVILRHDDGRCEKREAQHKANEQQTS